MTIAFVLGGLTALGGLVFWLERKAGAAAEVYLRTNCPSCRQKLRFPERQAGQPAACPRCKRLYTLPVKAALRPAK